MSPLEGNPRPSRAGRKSEAGKEFRKIFILVIFIKSYIKSIT